MLVEVLVDVARVEPFPFEADMSASIEADMLSAVTEAVIVMVAVLVRLAVDDDSVTGTEPLFRSSHSSGFSLSSSARILLIAAT